MKELDVVLVLDQFNPVSKRVCDVTTPHAGNASIVRNLNSARFQLAEQPVIVKAPQRRMCLSCRTKIRFYTKMNLHRSALKPAPPSFGQLGRLRNFLHPEQRSVKRPSPVLSTGRHSQLHMVNRAERIGTHRQSRRDSRLGCPAKRSERSWHIRDVHRQNNPLKKVAGLS